jgi:ribosomal protein S18 acetylase RimI-like enzyme
VNKNFTFCIATSENHYHDAILLFQEYANSLNISLDFQHFDGAPDGQLIVVYDAGIPVACAALRKIGEDISEVKRMYVKPSHRKLGIADTMLEMLIMKAKSSKYHLMRLDTLDTMIPAITLYKKNGFYEIDSYYFNPNKNTVYMEKKLNG